MYAYCGTTANVTDLHFASRIHVKALEESLVKGPQNHWAENKASTENQYQETKHGVWISGHKALLLLSNLIGLFKLWLEVQEITFWVL